MHNKFGFSIAILVISLTTSFAHAAVDEQCIERWEKAVVAQSLGARCKWMDNAASNALLAAQNRSLTCAESAATDAEKDEINTMLDRTRSALNKSFDDSKCSNNELRAFYNSQVKGTAD
jgi:hypothetical protein